MKEGCSNLYAGYTGTGKTPTIRRNILAAPMPNQVVYDPNFEQEPNREWETEGNYPYDKWTVYHDWDAYLLDLPTVEGAHCVTEDATIELNSMSPKDLKKLMIGIEHNNNIWHGVFHGLMDIPPFCLRQAHFLYLFKTRDNEKSVRTERSEFYNYYLELKKNPDPFALIIINLREYDTEGNFIVERTSARYTG